VFPSPPQHLSPHCKTRQTDCVPMATATDRIPRVVYTRGGAPNNTNSTNGSTDGRRPARCRCVTSDAVHRQSIIFRSGGGSIYFLFLRILSPFFLPQFFFFFCLLNNLIFSRQWFIYILCILFRSGRSTA